jgi:hypothetical protein
MGVHGGIIRFSAFPQRALRLCGCIARRDQNRRDAERVEETLGHLSGRCYQGVRLP